MQSNDKRLWKLIDSYKPIQYGNLIFELGNYLRPKKVYFIWTRHNLPGCFICTIHIENTYNAVCIFAWKRGYSPPLQFITTIFLCNFEEVLDRPVCMYAWIPRTWLGKMKNSLKIVSLHMCAFSQNIFWWQTIGSCYLLTNNLLTRCRVVG